MSTPPAPSDPSLLQLTADLLFPLFGIVASAVVAWVAYQQLILARTKFRLERYARRSEIYGEVMKLLSIITRDAAVEMEPLLAFIRATAEADFLFGPEVGEYLRSLYQRGIDLRLLQLKRGDPSPDRRAELAQRESDVLLFFGEQYEGARKVFHKYLDLSDPP